jgi:vacuolar-type H+-ATPase subunit I/STV1
MEKESAIQCVPVELIGRLKALASRLWSEKNPVSVHLNAVLEEFEPDVKSLGHIIKEYESEYSARLAQHQDACAAKEGRLRKELEDLTARLAGAETVRDEALRRVEEMRAALAERGNALSALKVKSSETEGDLNSRYVAKMQELYDKVNKKELDMLARWEEKNKSLETRSQEFEADLAARGRQQKLREKALEEEFNARKAELIRTFDRIREGLEVRERALAAGEAKTPAKGGAL